MWDARLGSGRGQRRGGARERRGRANGREAGGRGQGEPGGGGDNSGLGELARLLYDVLLLLPEELPMVKGLGVVVAQVEGALNLAGHELTFV